MYYDLARELKKLKNMNVMIIPIVIGIHGTFTKGLIQGLEELEITKLLYHWDQPEYEEESWRLEEICCTPTSVKDH